MNDTHRPELESWVESANRPDADFPRTHTLKVKKHEVLAALQQMEAARETGFYDQSHLSRHFKSRCGMTPGQYLSSARRA